MAFFYFYFYPNPRLFLFWENIIHDLDKRNMAVIVSKKSDVNKSIKAVEYNQTNTTTNKSIDTVK